LPAARHHNHHNHVLLLLPSFQHSPIRYIPFPSLCFVYSEFIAWPLPSLGLWFTGLLDREKQLTSWLTTQRPVAFWLTGFFNPQGFLVCRGVVLTNEHRLRL